MILSLRSYRLLILSGFILILSACSVEKNTGTTRFYHGLTARFNIYFNGYESFKAGIERINSGYRDDFAELLRVFEFSDPATAGLCSADMDRAIQKASKLISLKSITAKPEIETRKDLSPREKALLEQKEFNEWVDDSYLLIAKARFYRHEFNEAESVFNYCIAEANDPEIRTESAIWLARIANEKGSYMESNRILNELEITDSSPKYLQSMYHTTVADLYIKQKRFAEAVKPLESSASFMQGKRNRYRLTYLLAQIYERSGDPGKATELYRHVVNMNPPYDVEFNARINIAGVFDVSSGNPGEISRELEKMLRDSKNKQFQDQIYYALGNLMLREGDEEKAVEYYRKSASSVSENPNQRGRSYLALAEYYYKKPDYINAGKFYDSTVFFLDRTHPDYKELAARSQNLNALVDHLRIIQREDSLRKVAAMPGAQRDALIAGIISKIIKDESEGRISEYSDRANIGQYYENQRRFEDNINQDGKWYFYNQAALTFGRTEFRRRWGDRRLEDNWRRSNKARSNFQQGTNGQEEVKSVAVDTAGAENDYKKPEFYLKNLPLTDSLMAVSDERLALAWYNAGIAFTERIADTLKAAETYEKLLTGFPGHELIPETLYNLYNILKKVDNLRAETYRQRLLVQYPASEFSKILTDPGYYEKVMAQMKMTSRLYQQAWDLYSAGSYPESIALCDSVLSVFKSGDLLPKFALLRSYSVARTGNERYLKDELEKVVTGWPGTAEAGRAGELIAWLNQEMPELKLEEEKKIAVELYTADTTSVHSYAIVIMDPAFNINQATFDVISFNIDNYTNQNLRTEGTLTDNRYIIITVSGFADNRQARQYYMTFDPLRTIRNAARAKVLTFLINSNNLKALGDDKNPERYNLFFIENYLNWQKNR